MALAFWASAATAQTAAASLQETARDGEKTALPGQSITEADVTVSMTNTLKFTADTARIEAGQTVQWENSSLQSHTVTGDPEQAARMYGWVIVKE